MQRQEKHSRLAIWFFVFITLILTFILAWKKVEQEASRTALTLASTRILDQANAYKQQWILNGKPKQLYLNQKLVRYSKYGWPLPFNLNQKVDCSYWLDLLYPERRVFESLPLKIIDQSIPSDFQCQYVYKRNHAIEIRLIDENFNTNVSFTSEYNF